MKLLFFALIAFIIYLNLHDRLVKLFKLTVEGPWVCNIKKVVQASCHQGHLPHGDSAGMQCTSNAYLAPIFSVIKNISLWKTYDLDYILDQGDWLFKSVDIDEPLVVDELSLNLTVEGANVSAEMLTCESFFVEKSILFENIL